MKNEKLKAALWSLQESLKKVSARLEYQARREESKATRVELRELRDELRDTSEVIGIVVGRLAWDKPLVRLSKERSD